MRCRVTSTKKLRIWSQPSKNLRNKYSTLEICNIKYLWLLVRKMNSSVDYTKERMRLSFWDLKIKIWGIKSSIRPKSFRLRALNQDSSLKIFKPSLVRTSLSMVNSPRQLKQTSSLKGRMSSSKIKRGLRNRAWEPSRWKSRMYSRTIEISVLSPKDIKRASNKWQTTTINSIKNVWTMKRIWEDPSSWLSNSSKRSRTTSLRSKPWRDTLTT